MSYLDDYDCNADQCCANPGVEDLHTCTTCEIVHEARKRIAALRDAPKTPHLPGYSWDVEAQEYRRHLTAAEIAEGRALGLYDGAPTIDWHYSCTGAEPPRKQEAGCAITPRDLCRAAALAGLTANLSTTPWSRPEMIAEAKAYGDAMLDEKPDAP